MTKHSRLSLGAASPAKEIRKAEISSSSFVVRDAEKLRIENRCLREKTEWLERVLKMKEVTGHDFRHVEKVVGKDKATSTDNKYTSRDTQTSPLPRSSRNSLTVDVVACEEVRAVEPEHVETEPVEMEARSLATTSTSLFIGADSPRVAKKTSTDFVVVPIMRSRSAPLVVDVQSGVDLFASCSNQSTQTETATTSRKSQTEAPPSTVSRVSYCLARQSPIPGPPAVVKVESRMATTQTSSPNNDVENQAPRRKHKISHTAVYVPDERTDRLTNFTERLARVVSGLAPEMERRLLDLAQKGSLESELLQVLERAVFDFNWKYMDHSKKVGYINELRSELAATQRENANLNRLRSQCKCKLK